MSKQEKLSQKGYIFGLGAFRRYKEITGNDISHFEEALKPEFLRNEKGEVQYDGDEPIRIRDINVDEVEANYRWAVMLKCANDVYCNINGGVQSSVDAFTVYLSEADQSESNVLISQYLDSNYMGKPMRDYYGIPKVKEEAKKKPSPRAKPTSKR